MKHYAFTLAEILITLGIIGIVAAITIPLLIQSHKKQEYSAKIKKFYSNMEQAIKLSELDNGSISDWVRNSNGNLVDQEGNKDYEANGKVVTEFFMTYLAPYFKYTTITEGKNTIDENGNKSGINPKIYLADGTTVTLWNGGCIDIDFDVNGDSRPNTAGRDKFKFGICFTESYRKTYCGSSNKVFCATAENIDNNSTRTDIRNNCINHPGHCSRLLQYDGWEFKNDYPYRL